MGLRRSFGDPVSLGFLRKCNTSSILSSILMNTAKAWE